MNQKTKCVPCGRFFPSHLIQPHFISGRGFKDKCPICALKDMNKIHGMNRTQFNGTMANDLLTEARAYLSKHS